MKRDQVLNVGMFLVLVALGVATRWLSKIGAPTLSNFTATGAAALFAGYFFSSRLAALLVPLAILIVSNLFLDRYDSPWQFVAVAVAMILPVPLGWLLRRRPTALRVLGFAAVPGVVFFLVTNMVFWPGCDLYPKTIAGQMQSYVAGLPFFRNTLAGDLLFSGLIFGVYWLAQAVGIVSQPAATVAVQSQD